MNYILETSRDVAAWPVYVTIRNLFCEARRQRSTPSTLLARFIPTTKIRNPLLKSQVYHYCIGKLLSRKFKHYYISLHGRTLQCYLTICAILADYEEQVLLTSVKKNRYCMRCTRTEQFTRLQQERCLDKGHNDFVHLVDCFGWKHYNFNIHVSLATDTLHLLLKGLTGTEQKAIIQQLIAVVSLLFVSKAPFALHFIRAVCDLVTLAQYKSYDEDTLAYIQGALERMNVFKEEFRVYRRTLGEEKNFNYPKWYALTHIIQDIRIYRALDSICTGANSEAHYITIVKQFYSMTNKKDEVAANIAISDFTHAAAVKRHNDSKHCDEEVLYLILIIIDYTRYDKDRKHIAYIRAFSEVLLFNNNGQIDNTTRMLTFKFYDLSTIIRLVHLVPRDLPDSTTRTTISYYVNNYID
ncbi:hypothetical protein HBI59_128560 [Parastagonospora nodorum]|nr:hypothetical protein HBI59_128560 [Parastagonospora nodorum]